MQTKTYPGEKVFFFASNTKEGFFSKCRKNLFFYLIEWWSEAMWFLTSEVEDAKSAIVYLKVTIKRQNVNC